MEVKYEKFKVLVDQTRVMEPRRGADIELGWFVGEINPYFTFCPFKDTRSEIERFGTNWFGFGDSEEEALLNFQKRTKYCDSFKGAPNPVVRRIYRNFDYDAEVEKSPPSFQVLKKFCIRNDSIKQGFFSPYTNSHTVLRELPAREKLKMPIVNYYYEVLELRSGEKAGGLHHGDALACIRI